jgi:hypothetical protein
MATINQVQETPSGAAATAVIRVEEAHKYYDLGETRVHALRGVSVDIGRGICSRGRMYRSTTKGRWR